MRPLGAMMFGVYVVVYIYSLRTLLVFTTAQPWIYKLLGVATPWLYVLSIALTALTGFLTWRMLSRYVGWKNAVVFLVAVTAVVALMEWNPQSTPPPVPASVEPSTPF
ncbi:MAG: hypothetical protein ACK4SY_10125 [Pyrobaculum sp.]